MAANARNFEIGKRVIFNVDTLDCVRHASDLARKDRVATGCGYQVSFYRFAKTFLDISWAACTVAEVYPISTGECIGREQLQSMTTHRSVALRSIRSSTPHVFDEDSEIVSANTSKINNCFNIQTRGYTCFEN